MATSRRRVAEPHLFRSRASASHGGLQSAAPAGEASRAQRENLGAPAPSGHPRVLLPAAHPQPSRTSPLTSPLRAGVRAALFPPLRAGVRAALFLLCAAAACRTPDFTLPTTYPKPARGMVVSEQPLATDIGVRILERGGNAADAAVATALALAVVHPQAGNLGGGGFALWVPHSGEPLALDFRETAPSDTSVSLYLDDSGRAVPERSRTGPLSVGVPGSPAGLWHLHKRLGSGHFTFEDLAKPAIELARKGFPIDEHLAAALADSSFRARLQLDEAARQVFYAHGVPAAGALLVQTDLAATLTALARGGPEAFYVGGTARAIVQAVSRPAAAAGGAAGAEDRPLAEAPAHGTLSLEDLREYQPVWRAPLRGWFRGLEVITFPPPSSGGIILLETLGVLDGFPLESERRATLAERPLLSAEELDADAAGVGERIVHWWIEALRVAFAERARVMGDPDFTPVPVGELLSSQWIAKARTRIGEQAQETVEAGWAVREGGQTTHLSVLDRDGNAVSLTTTLNSTFGSCAMAPGAGLLLNNELDDFAIQPDAPNLYGLVGGEANVIQPRKRPLSSMTPTVLRDGGHTVSLVLGSPGGPRIITAVIGVVLRTVVFGESLEDAVRAPRFHQQFSPATTEFEPGWPAPLLDGLRRRNHALAVKESRWASVQAIAIDPHTRAVTGSSDPRAGGSARATRK
jgi:gamma-glutamyltranspeptidase / glutathione hydrolase